jgi:hypothetical protein
MPLMRSSLFCKLKFIKFVSMSTRYGGTSAELCARNNDDATCGLSNERNIMKYDSSIERR